MVDLIGRNIIYAVVRLGVKIHIQHLGHTVSTEKLILLPITILSSRSELLGGMRAVGGPVVPLPPSSAPAPPLSLSSLPLVPLNPLGKAGFAASPG